MAILTYKDLRIAVADWMDRPELADKKTSVVGQGNIDLVSVFSSHVEAECNRKLRTEDMATIIFNSGCEDQNVVLLPDNILGLRLVTVNSLDAEYLTPEQFISAANFYCGTGHMYTRIANQVHVWPELAVADDITMVAYITVPPLINDNDVNWVLRKFPDIYLYGCLYEASAYVFDSEHAMEWKQKFDVAINDLIQTDAADRWSGSSMRVRNV